MYYPRSQRPITANDTNTTRNANESHPHPTNHRKSSGVTIVDPTTAIATHTHTQHRKAIVPKTAATPLTPAVHQAPTSRLCGHARHRPTPTPRGGGQTTHTQSKQSRCVPFSDPHVHKVQRSNETTQGCSHSRAHTSGPIHHMARTHQTDDKSKEREKDGVQQQRVLC